MLLHTVVVLGGGGGGGKGGKGGNIVEMLKNHFIIKP